VEGLPGGLEGFSIGGIIARRRHIIPDAFVHSLARYASRGGWRSCQSDYLKDDAQYGAYKQSSIHARDYCQRY
jgi:hypothetical protein